RPAERGTSRVLRQHHDDRPVARADGTGGVQHRAVEDADVSGDRARRRDRTGGTRVRRDVAEPVPALLRRPRPGERARDTERLVVPVGAARRRLVQVAHHEVAYRGGRRVEQVPACRSNTAIPALTPAGTGKVDGAGLGDTDGATDGGSEAAGDADGDGCDQTPTGPVA